MALFDGYDPQGFADRGGLLGRLRSLRPDLVFDNEEDEQTLMPRELMPLWLKSGTSLNSPVSPSSPSADGANHPKQYAQGQIGILSPDPFYISPGDRRFENLTTVSSQSPSWEPAIVAGGALLGLGAAALGMRGSNGLGGLPQPIAPVFPDPPDPPLAPQTPLIPPHVSPTPPQLGAIPAETTSASRSTPTPSSEDWQQALGPEWQQLQSFFDNTRDRSSDGGGEQPRPDCDEQTKAAIEHCSKTSNDDNRHLLGPFSGEPLSWNDCLKGFLHKDCGGHNSKDPANYYYPWSRRQKNGRGSRRKR